MQRRSERHWHPTWTPHAGHLALLPGGQADYDQRSGTLAGRLQDLLSRPVIPAGYDKRPTGKTYRQLWDSSDTHGRRMLMVKAGYEFRAAKEGKSITLAFQLDPELAARAQAAAAGETVQLPGHGQVQGSWLAANSGEGYSVDLLADGAPDVETLLRRHVAARAQDAANSPEV